MITATVRTNSSYPADTLTREVRAAFAEVRPELHFSAKIYQQADQIKIIGRVEYEDFVVAALCYSYPLAPGWERICRQYAEDLSQWIYVP